MPRDFRATSVLLNTQYNTTRPFTYLASQGAACFQHQILYKGTIPQLFPYRLWPGTKVAKSRVIVLSLFLFRTACRQYYNKIAEQHPCVNLNYHASV